ncbi:MAG: hypothetical protein K1X82_12250 [Bacteroidia bacterium]|nr:hypothetical protein [Bacteroidia bacterium]
MNYSNTLFYLALSGTILVSSCKKDETTDNNTSNLPSANSPATPQPSDAGGVCAAVKTVTYQTVPIIGQQEIILGLGVAGFWEEQGTYIDGGTVKCNNTALKKFDNNAYTNEISQTNITGIDFGNSDVTWDVTGAANVTAFNKVDNTNWPASPQIDLSGSTVSHSSAFSFNLVSPIYSADSVLFTIAGGSGNVTLQKTVAGSASGSVPFTQAEMNTIGTGSGIIQVAAYNYTSETFGGRKVYFVKETVNTKTVTFN